jgi:hypothetical protein
VGTGEGWGGGTLHRHPRRFACLSLAADSHDDALAFVQLPAAREDLALRQEGGPAAADIDKRRVERRQKPHDAAEMDAAGFATVAALDVELDRHALFEQRRAPLAGASRDQQFAIQLGR